MNVIAKINQDRMLCVEVDSECSEVWVTGINLYTCESLSDKRAVLSRTYGSGQSYISDVFYENEVNINMGILFPDYAQTDFINDLIVIEVLFDSSVAYQVSCGCADNVDRCMTATYYKCRLYERIMNALGSVEGDCSDINGSLFVDEVLKKKMVDTCIDTKQFGKACRLWGRFYSTGKVSSKGGCGCGG